MNTSPPVEFNSSFRNLERMVNILIPVQSSYVELNNQWLKDCSVLFTMITFVHLYIFYVISFYGLSRNGQKIFYK
jgi:hypothetical protein